MTLAGYRRNGMRKRSNLRLVMSVAHKLFSTQPQPLTMAQIRQAGQAQAREGR